jgi:hypothetical protein
MSPIATEARNNILLLVAPAAAFSFATDAGNGGGNATRAGVPSGSIATPSARMSSMLLAAGAGVAAASPGVVATMAVTPDKLVAAATTGSSTTGSTSTMLPHFGQGKICPIAAALVTRRGLRQVVHWMEKGVTVLG